MACPVSALTTLPHLVVPNIVYSPPAGAVTVPPGSIIDYACRPGFDLFTANNVPDTEAQYITCKNDGSFTPPAGTCLRKLINFVSILIYDHNVEILNEVGGVSHYL